MDPCPIPRNRSSPRRRRSRDRDLPRSGVRRQPSWPTDRSTCTSTPAPTPRDWDPLTDEKWAFERGQVVLTEAGTNPGGPRRPFEYAVVTKGPELSSLRLEADVRIDEAVEVTNRDVVLIWNYQSPTRFYYAHLSTDNTIYPHNGIFVVDDADRLRIDDQWNGAVGAPPAITDAEWHDVRIDYDAGTGEIAVYVDRATPAADDRHGHDLLGRPARLRIVRQLRPHPARQGRRQQSRHAPRPRPRSPDPSPVPARGDRRRLPAATGSSCLQPQPQ